MTSIIMAAAPCPLGTLAAAAIILLVPLLLPAATAQGVLGRWLGLPGEARRYEHGERVPAFAAKAGPFLSPR